MIVIVPHPDIELKLIKMQKEIIRQIIEADKEAVPYSAMPLWIETRFDSVEEAKTKIKKVMILQPEYNEEEKKLVCPIEIETIDGIINSKLDFICGLLRCARNDKMARYDGTKTLCHCEERSDEAIHLDNEIFPLAVKIFRLGECTSSKPGVYELSSTIWKKLSS